MIQSFKYRPRSSPGITATCGANNQYFIYLFRDQTTQTTGVAYIPDTIIGPNPNPKGGGLCRMIVFVTYVSMRSQILALHNTWRAHV